MNRARNYALWEYEKFICERPIKDLAKQIGCPINTLYSARRNEGLISNRYQVTEGKSYPPKPYPWETEDNTTYALWGADRKLVGCFPFEEIVKMTGIPPGRLRSYVKTNSWVDSTWFISQDENTPPQRPPRRMAVYQIWEDGEILAEGSAVELNRRFGYKHNRLYDCANYGYKLDGKYEVSKNGEPPVDRTKMPDRSHEARKRSAEKTRCNKASLTSHTGGRGGSPGHPVPFDRMKPLSQDVYLARQAGMSYGQYKGQTYKPMCKTDRMKDGLLERTEEKK
ncbi:MAG: hypothetical protein LUE23_04340 [Lachnospiraceae bacterium]|nr:hypothetical protein [Lachnospiraceae bacterium]